MNTIENRRRRLPPELDPIVHKGIVYKELRQANKLGYEQKSGFLIALDEKTNEQLWVLRVYEIEYDKDKETDVQEVFFTQMELLSNQNTIFIENELDKQFLVDIVNRTTNEK